MTKMINEEDIGRLVELAFTADILQGTEDSLGHFASGLSAALEIVFYALGVVGKEKTAFLPTEGPSLAESSLNNAAKMVGMMKEMSRRYSKKLGDLPGHREFRKKLVQGAVYEWALMEPIVETALREFAEAFSFKPKKGDSVN